MYNTYNKGNNTLPQADPSCIFLSRHKINAIHHSSFSNILRSQSVANL